MIEAMTILAPVQIAQYAYDAGFRGDAVAYITACALAESGGDTEAVSGVVSDGTRGYGLVQIETENVQGGDWQSPSWQMSKALAMSEGGTNFNPWCTACAPMPCGGYDKGCGGYGSGAAASHLAVARAAAADVHGASAPAAATTPWPGTYLELQTPPIYQHGTGMLQEQLNKVLGCHLVIDMYFGADTAAAVRDYQRLHGLTQDGVVGPATWDKLFA
jgi:peptidoglycan hydrolase-like protein with peptidoglycan-binding domain